jgi:hypothetical protein
MSLHSTTVSIFRLCQWWNQLKKSWFRLVKKIQPTYLWKSVTLTESLHRWPIINNIAWRQRAAIRLDNLSFLPTFICLFAAVKPKFTLTKFYSVTCKFSSVFRRTERSTRWGRRIIFGFLDSTHIQSFIHLSVAESLARLVKYKYKYDVIDQYTMSFVNVIKIALFGDLTSSTEITIVWHKEVILAVRW